MGWNGNTSWGVWDYPEMTAEQERAYFGEEEVECEEEYEDADL